MSLGTIAVGEIEAARQYTLGLLNDCDDALWFRQPAEGVTHVAWQVGHLAFAEFSLVIGRLGEIAPRDIELPPRHAELFGRQSIPVADASRYPSPAELRATLTHIHAAALATVAACSDAQLQEPASRPHPRFATRLGAVFWCARHEMLHAGQIGLLKRLLGLPPQW